MSDYVDEKLLKVYEEFKTECKEDENKLIAFSIYVSWMDMAINTNLGTQRVIESYQKFMAFLDQWAYFSDAEIKILAKNVKQEFDNPSARESESDEFHQLFIDEVARQDAIYGEKISTEEILRLMACGFNMIRKAPRGLSHIDVQVKSDNDAKKH